MSQSRLLRLFSLLLPVLLHQRSVGCCLSQCLCFLGSSLVSPSVYPLAQTTLSWLLKSSAGSFSFFHTVVAILGLLPLHANLRINSESFFLCLKQEQEMMRCYHERDLSLHCCQKAAVTQRLRAGEEAGWPWEATPCLSLRVKATLLIWH